MAGGDKFGNFCVVRVPQDMSQIIEDDPTGGKSAAISGKLNSAPHKLEPIANFHAGDLIMSLQLCALQQGGQEVSCCSTCSTCILQPFNVFSRSAELLLASRVTRL
jgi:splicing factor 3B subunit 3